MNDGRLEREMDRRNGASSVLMRALLQSVVVGEGEGAEPEGEAFNLLVHLCSNPRLRS